MRTLAARGVFLLALSLALCRPGGASAPEHRPTTVMPVPQEASWWHQRHERILERIRHQPVELVFLGDSIIQGWEDEGRRVWDRYYTDGRALNLGFDSDRVEHLLWRLEQGELEGLAPKVAIVLIGTNNAGQRRDRPEDTAEGIRTLVSTLRTKLPKTKVLLLAIFPRGATPQDPFRTLNDAVTEQIARLADHRQVFFLDLRSLYLDPEGRVRRDLMPDLLHPNEEGYRRWAVGMEGTLKQLLKE